MLTSILQDQMSHTCPKTHPMDPENSPLRPVSTVETQDIRQKLALTHNQ
jgi:hypothetical protein